MQGQALSEKPSEIAIGDRLVFCPLRLLLSNSFGASRKEEKKEKKKDRRYRLDAIPFWDGMDAFCLTDQAAVPRLVRKHGGVS